MLRQNISPGKDSRSHFRPQDYEQILNLLITPTTRWRMGTPGFLERNRDEQGQNWTRRKPAVHGKSSFGRSCRLVSDRGVWLELLIGRRPASKAVRKSPGAGGGGTPVRLAFCAAVCQPPLDPLRTLDCEGALACHVGRQSPEPASVSRVQFQRLGGLSHPRSKRP